MEGIEDLAMGILKTGKLSVQGDPGGAIITIIFMNSLFCYNCLSKIRTVLYIFLLYFVVLVKWSVVLKLIVILTLTRA